MGFLVSRGINGTMSYKGIQYVNPDKGTHRLCLRTGLGSGDVVKYGLTSHSSASKYCGMKMIIDGNTAYIGRSEQRAAEGNCFSSISSVATEGAYSRLVSSKTEKWYYNRISNYTSTVITSSVSGDYTAQSSGTTINIYTKVSSGSLTYRESSRASSRTTQSTLSSKSLMTSSNFVFMKDSPNCAAEVSCVTESTTDISTYTRSTTCTQSSYSRRTFTASDTAFSFSLAASMSTITWNAFMQTGVSSSSTYIANKSSWQSTTAWKTYSTVSATVTFKGMDEGKITDNFNL